MNSYIQWLCDNYGINKELYEFNEKYKLQIDKMCIMDYLRTQQSKTNISSISISNQSFKGISEIEESMNLRFSATIIVNDREFTLYSSSKDKKQIAENKSEIESLGFDVIEKKSKGFICLYIANKVRGNIDG